jgi:hypothetical protein
MDSPSNLLDRSSKWWQEEGISTILEPEHAEQEAVHEEHDAGPSQNCDLLRLRVGDPGHFQGERYC